MKKKETKHQDKRNEEVVSPILMTEEYWKESQLSIASHFGLIRFNGHNYIIVNKEGIDVLTLSCMPEYKDKKNVIEPGEPCDLLLESFQPIYKELGREAFIRMLKDNRNLTLSRAKELTPKYKQQ